MKLLKCSVVLSVAFLIALTSCQQSIDKTDTSKTLQDTIVKHEKRIVLIYRNADTGEILEYTPENLPWQDTVLFPKLVFVESIIKE